jgi:hypothetical protein
MLLVDPNSKEYMKWDLGAMMAGMSKVVNAVGGLVKMQISDVRIGAQDLGAGETVQGYPTRHIRMVQNYTVSASMFGKKSTSRTETTTDYYFAPSLKIANPFVANSQQMAMMSQFDMFKNPDYQSQYASANAKLPKNGVPLKTVTKTVTTDEKGKSETATTIMEMVNFKAANIPASAFAVPSDYKMVEMPNLNAAMTAGGNGNGAAGEKSAGFANLSFVTVTDPMRGTANVRSAPRSMSKAIRYQRFSRCARWYGCTRRCERADSPGFR